MSSCSFCYGTGSFEKINAKYGYGVSATTVRSGNLEKINYMLLDPTRHRYTALEQAGEQGIKGEIIHEGLVHPYGVCMGKNMKDEMKHIYLNAKNRNEIYICL